MPVVPALRDVIVVDEESNEPIPSEWITYEEALATGSAERIFTGRSSDDLYCACTGGTTGLPKGVMWRHEDIFFAAMGGGDLRRTQGPITVPEQLRERVDPSPMTMLMLPPLMHVSAQWGTFIMLYTGGKAVFLAPGVFDAEAAWKAIEAEQVNTVTLVGNAMARPLLDYYAAHHPDASSLFSVGSGGAILSASTKARIHELLPHVIVADGFGSSETGVAGGELTTAVTEAREMPVFNMDATTTILDEDLEPLVPGDGRIGNLARRGHIPLGYYKDPAKTATTFVEKDGVRWVLPGDMATVESDGSIVLHGRGSVSINTGGEKVFPEEVETALLAYPAIEDVVVVGVPDEHWGERVVAVAKPKVDTALGLGELQRFARAHLAGYKVPRSLVTVDAVVRTPSGKPDYVWARDIAQSDDTHDAVPRPMEAT
jgi:acyl-CoA synthetase (AMP-forming)/AMP-acid ligase II